MSDIEQRVQALEREHRNEWKDIIRRLSNIEADVAVIRREYDNYGKPSTQSNQSRQQDRWSGALWIAAWGIGTGLFTAGVVVALLSYLQ